MGMSITITNLSSAEFTAEKYSDGKCYYFSSESDQSMEMLSKTPSLTIAPHDGDTSFVTVDNILAGVETCRCDIWLTYYCSTGQGFGIKCHQWEKVIGIGANPTWELLDGTTNGKWVNQDHSTNPFTFTSMSGIRVVATPTVTPGNIAIDVMINNHKEGV